MAERVVTEDFEVTWEPNAPDALLLIGDYGKAVLALEAHPSDPDERCVVLVWTGTRSAQMSGPNDEAISGHRLYEHGLRDVRWAGVVINSELVRVLERQNNVHPRHDPSRFDALTHYVLPLKEDVVEVVAERLAVQRIAGSTLDAASEAMRS